MQHNYAVDQDTLTDKRKVIAFASSIAVIILSAVLWIARDFKANALILIVEPVLLLLFIAATDTVREKIVTHRVGKIVVYLFFGLWGFSIVFWIVSCLITLFDPYYKFDFDSLLYLINLLAYFAAWVNGGLYANNEITKYELARTEQPLLASNL